LCIWALSKPRRADRCLACCRNPVAGKSTGRPDIPTEAQLPSSDAQRCTGPGHGSATRCTAGGWFVPAAGCSYELHGPAGCVRHAARGVDGAGHASDVFLTDIPSRPPFRPARQQPGRQCAAALLWCSSGAADGVCSSSLGEGSRCSSP
jgi:hypothetical protein